MSQTYVERNEAWEGRAKALGPRAVLHVGHKTPEQQADVFRRQRVAVLPPFITEFNELELSRLQRVEHVNVLDFGCGVGRWTYMLSDLTGADVLGVDPTQSFLDHCNANRPRPVTTSPFVDFARLENGKIPAANGTFYVIWACMVLSTILDVEGGMFDATLKELDRVLASGGLMFLVDNTEGPVHRPIVRSPYSISRTVDQYRAAFKQHVNVDLRVLGDYVDLDEVNTIFAGRKP